MGQGLGVLVLKGGQAKIKCNPKMEYALTEENKMEHSSKVVSAHK